MFSSDRAPWAPVSQGVHLFWFRDVPLQHGDPGVGEGGALL